jgi:phenylacetate-coenzyme A ligase PaaK-like adenylate-forming protein
MFSFAASASNNNINFCSNNIKQPELLKYIEEHSNSMIPQVYEDNPALGKWVNRQRTKYKANNFSPERIEKLNEVGFCGMVKKLFA